MERIELFFAFPAVYEGVSCCVYDGRSRNGENYRVYFAKKDFEIQYITRLGRNENQQERRSPCHQASRPASANRSPRPASANRSPTSPVHPPPPARVIITRNQLETAVQAASRPPVVHTAGIQVPPPGNVVPVPQPGESTEDNEGSGDLLQISAPENDPIYAAIIDPTISISNITPEAIEAHARDATKPRSLIPVLTKKKAAVITAAASSSSGVPAEPSAQTATTSSVVPSVPPSTANAQQPGPSSAVVPKPATASQLPRPSRTIYLNPPQELDMNDQYNILVEQLMEIRPEIRPFAREGNSPPLPYAQFDMSRTFIRIARTDFNNAFTPHMLAFPPLNDMLQQSFYVHCKHPVDVHLNTNLCKLMQRMEGNPRKPYAQALRSVSAFYGKEIMEYTTLAALFDLHRDLVDAYLPQYEVTTDEFVPEYDRLMAINNRTEEEDEALLALRDFVIKTEELMDTILDIHFPSPIGYTIVYNPFLSVSFVVLCYHAKIIVGFKMVNGDFEMFIRSIYPFDPDTEELMYVESWEKFIQLKTRRTKKQQELHHIQVIPYAIIHTGIQRMDDIKSMLRRPADQQPPSVRNILASIRAAHKELRANLTPTREMYDKVRKYLIPCAGMLHPDVDLEKVREIVQHAIDLAYETERNQPLQQEIDVERNQPLQQEIGVEQNQP